MTDPTPAIDPSRTALLVMDYQNGIVDRLPDAKALLDRAAEAITTIRRHGGHIGYVRVAFSDADYDSIPPSSHFGAILARSGRAYHADAPATAACSSLKAKCRSTAWLKAPSSWVATACSASASRFSTRRAVVTIDSTSGAWRFCG